MAGANTGVVCVVLLAISIGSTRLVGGVEQGAQ